MTNEDKRQRIRENIRAAENGLMVGQAITIAVVVFILWYITR